MITFSTYKIYRQFLYKIKQNVYISTHNCLFNLINIILYICFYMFYMGGYIEGFVMYSWENPDPKSPVIFELLRNLVF